MLPSCVPSRFLPNAVSHGNTRRLLDRQSLRNQPTKRHERRPLLRHPTRFGCGYLLVCGYGLGLWPLGWRYLPTSSALESPGVVVAAAGIACAIWAPQAGLKLAIKKGHCLVRRGPFAVVRSPIYGSRSK
jgi:protein-S-isoprenylcysteine O-methyltransferase Ste14